MALMRIIRALSFVSGEFAELWGIRKGDNLYVWLSMGRREGKTADMDFSFHLTLKNANNLKWGCWAGFHFEEEVVQDLLLHIAVFARCGRGGTCGIS
jgi:hypothetical protein